MAGCWSGPIGCKLSACAPERAAPRPVRCSDADRGFARVRRTRWLRRLGRLGRLGRSRPCTDDAHRRERQHRHRRPRLQRRLERRFGIERSGRLAGATRTARSNAGAAAHFERAPDGDGARLDQLDQYNYAQGFCPWDTDVADARLARRRARRRPVPAGVRPRLLPRVRRAGRALEVRRAHGRGARARRALKREAPETTFFDGARHDRRRHDSKEGSQQTGLRLTNAGVGKQVTLHVGVIVEARGDLD